MTLIDKRAEVALIFFGMAISVSCSANILDPHTNCNPLVDTWYMSDLSPNETFTITFRSDGSVTQESTVDGVAVDVECFDGSYSCSGNRLDISYDLGTFSVQYMIVNDSELRIYSDLSDSTYYDIYFRLDW